MRKFKKRVVKYQIFFYVHVAKCLDLGLYIYIYIYIYLCKGRRANTATLRGWYALSGWSFTATPGCCEEMSRRRGRRGSREERGEEREGGGEGGAGEGERGERGRGGEED